MVVTDGERILGNGDQGVAIAPSGPVLAICTVDSLTNTVILLCSESPVLSFSF